jgi:hypothetical protein
MISDNTVVEMDIIIEFVSAGTRSTELIRFWKFSTKWVPGTNLPFVTSEDLFVALTIIHINGKIETIVKIDRII